MRALRDPRLLNRLSPKMLQTLDSLVEPSVVLLRRKMTLNLPLQLQQHLRKKRKNLQAPGDQVDLRLRQQNPSLAQASLATQQLPHPNLLLPSLTRRMRRVMILGASAAVPAESPLSKSEQRTVFL